MRIKTLEVTGFKSFVDKTAFKFEAGITAVVGPNGCGKSNVVDAMRWSMGEQSPRRLRGKSMEDVIFAGAEGRAPVGMAEVVLTFDNSDGKAPAAYSAYSEIQISRRLYRSGESEYLINKTPVRLRDVLDFFRDTGIGTKGYTIVEQGQIGAIVSAKPEDRRILIEEAAGISKYKARRLEAERKISSTEQNLVRVNDVLSEIRRQINAIERQAKKAARYKRLREVMRALELSLARDEREELLEDTRKSQQALTTLRDEITALETQLSEGELALEQGRLQLAERERILNQGSEALYAVRTEIKQIESRVEYEKRERETLAETGARRREEHAQLADQLGTTEEEARQAEQALQALESALETEYQAIAEAESEVQGAGDSLRGLEEERERASGALVEVLTKIARDEDRLTALEDRGAEIDQRMRATDELLSVQQSESNQAAEEQSRLGDQLRELLAERDRLMTALRASLERQALASEEARAAAERLQQGSTNREQRRARLDSLHEVLDRREDVAEGTRHLLEQDESAQQAQGLRGLVRDVLEVDSEVEAAVEAILAERAEALIADDMEGALAALRKLRADDAGRGIFFVEPPAQVQSAGIVPMGEPLIERVRVREGFEGVARALLGGVNLVPDLGEVISVYGGGRVPATFVTLAGDVLSKDGVLTGGGHASRSGLLTRLRELRELEEEVKTIDGEVRELERAHRMAEAALQSASEDVDNLRNRHHTAALAVANHEKDLERTRERVKALGEVQEGRAAERASLLGEQEQMVAERERLAAELEAIRGDRTTRQSELDELGLKVGSAGRELARRETLLTDRRVEHATRVEKRDRLRDARDRASGAVAEIREWMQRREREIEEGEARRGELATSIENLGSELQGKLELEESARASNDEKRDAYEREAAQVRTQEDQVRELRGNVTSRREGIQGAEIAAREAELRLEHLETSIREKWGVELAVWTPEALETTPEEEPEEGEEGTAGERTQQALPLPVDVFSLPREERSQQLVEVRQKLEALGEVNLGAIEEHEELGERFRFLTEQKEDLEATLTSLREAIARINRTSRKRFRETFDKVAERFQEVFPRLFRGGRASLTLTESEDVLEAGIDIMAMPPGKRLQNVNLLSGGEKTLTALSLLIALFQVRPSPFFLLDEVDAPLDDANVGRFNEIVREMSEESQFLLITHNKRTIEVADVLYGVTMENRGISTLVSVELHDSV